MVSLAAVSDMALLYGPGIFNKEGSESENDITTSTSVKPRKLFSIDENTTDLNTSSHKNGMTFEGFVDVMVGILDEEVTFIFCDEFLGVFRILTVRVGVMRVAVIGVYIYTSFV